MKVTMDELIAYQRQRGMEFNWLRVHQDWIMHFNRWLDKNKAAVEEALKPLNEEQQKQAVLRTFFSHPDDYDIKAAAKLVQDVESLRQWRVTRGANVN